MRRGNRVACERPSPTVVSVVDLDSDRRVRAVCPCHASAKLYQGCIQCKLGHVRCDERKPDCLRCCRLRLDCSYPGKPSIKEVRRIRPAPSSWKLADREAPYLSHYQQVLAHELSNRPYGMSEFWHRTVLRDALQDRHVLDAVVAIGAMSRAKAAQSTSSYFEHYCISLQHYSRALTRFHGLLGAARPPESRKLLVTTLLITAFEELQGNRSGIDALAAKAFVVLKDVIMGGAAGSKDTEASSVAASIDDQGVEDAEFHLPRQGVLKAMTPVYPLTQQTVFLLRMTRAPRLPEENSSLADFNRRYMQYLTYCFLWIFRVGLLRIRGHPVDTDAALLDEQAAMNAQMQPWLEICIAYADRLRQAGLPLQAELLHFGTQVIYLSTTTALDSTGSSLSNHPMLQGAITRGRKVLELAGPVTATSRHVYDRVCFATLNLVREARGAHVRPQLQALIRRAARPSMTAETKTAYMGHSAQAQLEESYRGADGVLAADFYYDWTEGYWDEKEEEGQAVLHVVFTARGRDLPPWQKRHRRALRTKDFGL